MPKIKMHHGLSSMLCMANNSKRRSVYYIKSREDGDLPYEQGTGDLGHLPRQNSISEERRGTAFVELNKKEGCGLGLVLSGGLDKNTKPQISYLRPGGIAQRSDALEVGDYIVSVNGIRTALLRHDEIVNLLKNAGSAVVLEVEYELPETSVESPSLLHKRIEVHLEKDGHTYGFTLRGGLNTDGNKSRPLTVTQIRPGSTADREGTLKVGDRILMINAVNGSQKSLSDAFLLLARPQTNVHLLVEYDVSVMEAVLNATGPLLVEIDKTPGSTLGITLTTTTHKGRVIVCIETVKAASIADRCGALHAGDHVLAIDETSLEHISVAEATQLLRCGSAEHIKLEILPMRPPQQQHSRVSEISPRLEESSTTDSTALSPGRQFTPRSPSPNRSLQSFSTYNSLVNNCAPHATMPAFAVPNSRLPPVGPGNSARSSSLRPGWAGLRSRKASTTSLASTGTYSTLPISLAQQLYHTEVTEVLLVSDQHGYGFSLNAGAFPSDLLSEPPVINQVSENSAAERSAVIQEGDRLVAINGHFLDGRSLNEINQMLYNSSPKVTLHVEFPVAELVVTTTGTFTVKLAKRCSTLGITISAPTKRKAGDPLVISDVKKGSVAYRTGTIHTGDHLLAIDNVRTDTCSIEEAARLLQQADSVVKLKMRKDETFSDEPEPPPSITYTVELPKQGGPLGITVSGTEAPFDPIFISSLSKGGLAEKTGAIHVHDQILAINGETLEGRPLSEAIRMLQLTSDAVTLKITRPIDPPKRKNGVASKAHDSVDSALESWDSSGLDSNNATNGKTPTKTKHTDSPNDGSGSSSKEEPLLPTMHCCRPSGSSSSTWRRDKAYAADIGNGDLHINEDEWSRSSGATCSPSVPLSFSSSNDADEWSTRLYELDQLSSINRDAGKPRKVTSEGDVTNHVGLDDNANSVLYELDTASAASLAYDNGERGAVLPLHNGRLSGASSPDIDGFKPVGAEIHLQEVEEELRHIFTPTPLELFRVVLRKYSSLDDFGFGVSDGIYEKGVFISAIRPGGPADLSCVLNQYDRLLQVDEVRTKELNCHQVVPLIANAGNQVELVLSRNPIAEAKLQHHAEDFELWEMQTVDGLNTKEV